MKITHFNNSFISIKGDNSHIVCDPWMGIANQGGWHSFPEFSTDSVKSYLKDCDWVYISHIHDDHLSVDTIKRLDLLGKKFVIKNFENKILKRRLISLGVKAVVELDAFEIMRLNDIEIAILPQLSSNSSGLDETIDFDMDTSIAFKDGSGSTFLNLVDNPYSINDAVFINNWCLKNFGPIRVLALFAGAASEYPQAMFNIDRLSAREDLIVDSLHKIKSFLRIFMPEYYFPAGGTYFIPGQLSPLNHYIAQPSVHQIKSMLDESGLDTQLLDLEGGHSIEIGLDYEPIKHYRQIAPSSDVLSASISAHMSDKYPYEKLNIPTKTELELKIADAKSNWASAVSSLNIRLHQSLHFVVHAPLVLTDEQSVSSANIYHTFNLLDTKSSDDGYIIIHIDARLLFLCIRGINSWNGALGSLCLFERKPNRHFPSDLWSINYFVSKDKNVKSSGRMIEA